MDNNLKVKGLSQWGSGTEIIYSCCNCGASYNFYRNRELFCHNCGTKNEWANIPIVVTNEFAEMYHSANFEEQQKALSKLQKAIDKIVKKAAKN